MIRLRFREIKTTQAAARLLARAGGRLPYMSLIKLLYLADRQALVTLGKPVTWDLPVSMPHGPVLSRTLDLITDEPEPGHASYWHGHISRPDNYEVHLIEPPLGDQLSPAEEAVLDDVFHRFGHMNRWQLRDFTHTLPEWTDPHDSSVPISIRDIILHQGVSVDDADAIIRDLLAEATADEVAV